jgi:electron transfer flavoprotein beta subunit
MKILVCITQAPDTTTKISFTDNDTKLNENGVTWIINPYDEWYSLVRALELKEAGLVSEVALVTVGDASTEPVIRKALAIGGDQAIRVNAESKDSFYVASQIAAIAKQGAYDLILTGKESIDFNNGSTGALIAEFIDAPFIANATKLDLNGNTATVNREIEGGEEVNECSLPAVIACQKGIAEQRIPNMKGIMGARTKPLQVVEPVEITSGTTIVKYDMPIAKTGVKMYTVEQIDELVKALHEEAKVI